MTTPNKHLIGQVALVTGASRGIGRGIAVQLGEAGATVYVTGRKKQHQQGEGPTLEDTAQEVSKRGGKGIAVYCDHEDDKQVELVFQQIAKEQNGRLDILVNNAYAAVEAIFAGTGRKFFELPLHIYDKANNTGLRNHYVCSVFAAKLMVPRRSGLIVTISSIGGLSYLFNVAYGIGKAACDRLAADIAHELKEFNVTSVALWPGPVLTEFIQKNVMEKNKSTKEVFEKGESTEFSGKCIAALASDKNVFEKTGHILTTTQLAKKYGLKDENGVQPNFAPFNAAAKFLDQMNYLRTNVLEKNKL